MAQHQTREPGFLSGIGASIGWSLSSLDEFDYIRFTDDDGADMRAYFAHLVRDTTYGLRKFPSARLYRSRINDITRHQEHAATSRVYAIAQRDWHVRGQTGCMFARLAARSAEKLRWDYAVTSHSSASADLCSSAAHQLDAMIADPECQVLSLLFPAITKPAQALDTIYALTRYSPFWLEANRVEGGHLNLHVRYPVGDAGVQAWVMAFGPFGFLPNTRRAPSFELAVRVKPKPDQIFYRLNQDRDLAHLADAPLPMTAKHQEDRWQSTLKRTRMILGGEPDYISAAKSTLAIPVRLLPRPDYTGSHAPHQRSLCED